MYKLGRIREADDDKVTVRRDRTAIPGINEDLGSAT